LNAAVKNEFEYFTVYIPYFNRGLIEKVENLDIVPASSNISGSVNRRQLIWEIGQKFPSKTLKVTLQCDVCFSPDLPPKDSDFKEDPFCVNDNAYILVSFKCLDHVYSGVRIDPKSVSLIPSSKCKTSIGYEFSCTEYKIWNSHGDCDMAFLPNSADLEMLKQ
jgi:AP-5 complex subunit mu-1